MLLVGADKLREFTEGTFRNVETNGEARIGNNCRPSIALRVFSNVKEEEPFAGGSACSPRAHWVQQIATRALGSQC